MTNFLLDLQKATSSKDLSRYLELFYNDTAHLVFAYVRKKGLNPQDCEDIVQIVYSQIYHKRNKYNPSYSPLAWLFVITKSETKDYLKKTATYTDYLNDYGLFINLSQNHNDNPIIGEQEHQLDLARLNEREQIAVKQRYYEEKEFQEIAKALGLSENNVRKVISRALQKLKG